MTGAAFIILSLWVGFILEDKYGFLEKNFWQQCACAIIVGTLFSTWLTFLLSLFIGFSRLSLYLSLMVMALYAGNTSFRTAGGARAFWGRVFRNRRLPAVSLLLILYITPFFIFGVWEKSNGDIVYRGNYTDLSYHLSMVSAFLEQESFPPENPQCAGAKLSYHFLVNFHSAILHLGGIDLLSSVIIPQVLFAFALAMMIYSFYRMVLGTEKGTFFSAVLFIMGHIALFNVFFGLLGYLPPQMKLNLGSWRDTQTLLLYPFFNFLNPVINYFHPQRPFLFGFPLALILLSGIYCLMRKEKPDYGLLFGLALILGLTPLFHMHTFLVLAPILVLAALCMRGDFKRTCLSLLPLLLALGQLWFILSQPKAPGFSGFDVHKLGGGLKEINVLHSLVLSRVIFWIRVSGFPLILGCIGMVAYFKNNRQITLATKDGRTNSALLLFLTIPLLFFVWINFYRFSPNWGDSNKFFLYFDLILSLFAGRLLSGWFRKGIGGKMTAGILIVVSALGPSLLEAYVVFTRKGNPLFSHCDRMAADWIKANTSRTSVLLTSDDVIHYVPSLAGRRVVDGSYTWNTGFRQPGIEGEVRRIYRTGMSDLIRRYNITHVVIGPQERRKYAVREKAFDSYKTVYQQKCSGTMYRIVDATACEDRETGNGAAPPVQEDSQGKRVFLSDMKPVDAIQDFRPLHRDNNINGTPIRLNGILYEKGLGAHARSEIVYRLDRHYSRFESDVGLDDTQDNTPGSVVFSVYTDGRLQYRSPVMRWDGETQHVTVDIAGADELTLVVDDAGDGDACDHACWGDAAVY